MKKISSKGTSPDIRKYFPTNSRSSFTLDKEKNTGIDRIASTSISHSPSSNIHELKSQNNIDSPVGSHQLNQLFSGSGVTLGGTRKRSRLLDENENSSRNSKQAKISQISSEVIVVRTLSDDENGIIPMSSQEIIKQELEDEFDDDVILIDDEFDDSVGPTELVDTSIIDGIFEGDQHDFKSKTYLSDSMPSTSTATASGISPNSKSQLEKAGYSQTEINAMNDVSIPLPLVCCPVCNTRLQEIEINVHLDSCLNSFQV